MRNSERVSQFKFGQVFNSKSSVRPEGIDYIYWGKDNKEASPYNIKLVEKNNEEEIIFVETEWFNQRNITTKRMKTEVAITLIEQWIFINELQDIYRGYELRYSYDNDSMIFDYYSGTKGVISRVMYDERSDLYDIIVIKYKDNNILALKLLSGMGVEDLDIDHLSELI